MVMTGPSGGGRTAHIGRAAHRAEDAHLVTGHSRAVGNLVSAASLHLGVLRSPMAHATIDGVDLSGALALPEVVAAFSGADLASTWVQPLPVSGPDDAHRPPQWPVAADRVRFVGEPVAVVAATSAAAAVDALEHIDVDYGPLPAVPSVDQALEDRDLVHEDLGTNVVFRFQGQRSGDLDAAFDTSNVVLSRRYQQSRVMGVALEPRTVVAEPGSGGQLVIRTSTQVPHRIRSHVALMLGRDESSFDVIAMDVGGGFGPKLDCYAEEILCTELALRLERPVTFVATRTEDLQTTSHGRGLRYDITIGGRTDGTLTGLQVQVTGDCGAYLSRVGANILLNGNAVTPGCYRWEAYGFDATGVFTTTVPTAAYRGAGRPEAAYAVERAIDDLAHALGLDPADVRRRNFPAPDEFPFASIGGMTFDSGDYASGLDTALDAVDYPTWREAQAARLAAGDHRRLGIGMASYVDRCGTGPGMSEFGAVHIDPSGQVRVTSGLGPTGQGTGTTLAQIVADRLQVDMDAIEVVFGDTTRIPRGKGTFGSRSVSVGGVAVAGAVDRVIAAARRAAAMLLEANEEDLDVADGGLVVRGDPGTHLSFADIAAAVENREVDDMDGLQAVHDHEPDGFTFPFGTHAAVVEIDTETGRVDLLRFVAVDDSGVIINPALLQGQVHGGVAQGIAQALYEGVVHDDNGNLLTSSLIDYLVPTAPDLPHLETLTTTSHGDNPLGTKGVGESGTIGAPPAVVNAVVDALRGFGVQDVQMPCSPQRVWQAIRDGQQATRG